MCIFAEATATNGAFILPFKRGAFQGMRTVLPCYLTWTQNAQFNPTYESMYLTHWLAMFFSCIGFYTMKLHIMPPFTPNHIMLEKHADKGKTDWEIYAWCVRDAIAKKGSLIKVENNSFRDKYAYLDFMLGSTDQMEVQGRIFKIGYTSALDLNLGCYHQMQEEEEDVVL
jgi:hypothetical protein